MTDSVAASLQGFMERYTRAVRESSGSLPKQTFDPDWPSPCQVGEPDPDGNILWRPVQRLNLADFSGLENALNVTIHNDIKQYYGCFWSDVIEAASDDGNLTLIQIWNEDDFERLVTNLIGHAIAKERAKQPLTLFFACTDEDELFLSVENESGRVLLEQPGSPPLREIAPRLAVFLNQLKPIIEAGIA